MNPGQAATAPSRPRRHDPRIDPPTRADKRRLWAWVALLGFSPICLAVVAWAALGLNGSYPTVAPPVPAGWQPVPGIYASISVPKSWKASQFLSDANGDTYYSGDGGGAGISAVESDTAPSHTRPFPPVVGDFLGGSYRVTSAAPTTVGHAAMAWRYGLVLPGGGAAGAVLAWSKLTQTRVWVVVSPLTPTTQKVLSTLRLAT